MTEFDKYDSNLNPKWEPDALVVLEFFSSGFDSKKPKVLNGFKPLYRIKEDYLTSTSHFFIDAESIKAGEQAKAFVKFITPEEYPHSLELGRIISVQVGSRIIGSAKVLEIYNSLLVESIDKAD